MKLYKFFHFIKKPLCNILIVIILWPSSPNFAADIEVRDSAIFIDQTESGTDIVYIKDPNTDELSYNTFERFNVDEPGAVIHNSVNGGGSQLVGALGGNPFLQGREAALVVFDVLGGQRSDLNGLMEMFGRRADFVLSNAYGISVNGGGFLNMSRVMLTTGRALDSTYQNYGVQKGIIRIGERGLYAAGLSHLDLASRFVHIEGVLMGGDQLRVVAGRNNLSLTGILQRVNIPNEDSVTTRYAIDASALGAIQAGSIYLVSTEHGLGVNTQGILNAKDSDINIHAEGDVLINTAIAEKKISIESEGGIFIGNGNQESVLISKELNVCSNSHQQLKNTQFHADDILVQAKGSILVDRSVFMGGVSQIASQENLEIKDSMINTTDQIHLKTDQHLQLSQSTLESDDLNLKASSFNQDQGYIGAGRIDISSTQGPTLNRITLSGTTVIDDNLELNAHEMIISGHLYISNNSQIMAQNVSQNGSLEIAGRLMINADDITNTGETKSQEMIFLSHDIRNSGTLLASKEMQIQSQRIINDGLIQSAGDVSINPDQLIQRGSVIIENDLSISTPVWMNEGFIQSGGVFSSQSQEMTNLNSIVANRLELTSDTLNNDGLLYANTAQLNGNVLTNAGELYTEQLQVRTDLLNNSDSIVALESLEIQSLEMINDGLIQSSGDLNLTLDQLIQRGSLMIENNLTISTPVWNNEGLIQVGGTFSNQSQVMTNLDSIVAMRVYSHTQNFNNDGAILSDDMLNLVSEDGSNNGYIHSMGQGVINANQWINNGLLKSNNDLVVDTNILRNTSIINAENIILSSHLLENQSMIESELDTSIETEILENTGDILAGRFLNSHSHSLENNGRMLVLGNGVLDVDTTTLSNDNGLFISNGDIRVNLNNNYVINGVFHALNTVDISAFSIQNYGDLKANQSVVFNSTRGDFINHENAIIQSHDAVSIYSAEDIINKGSMVSVLDMQLNAFKSIKNEKNATMLSDSNIALSAENLTNEGRMYAMGEGVFELDDNLKNAGEIIMLDDIQMNAKMIKNQHQLLAGQNLLLHADQLYNTGRLQSGNNMRLVADFILNGAATINHIKTNASTAHMFKQKYKTLTQRTVLDHWNSDKWWKRKGNEIYAEETILFDDSDKNYHKKIKTGSDHLVNYHKGEMIAGNNMDIINQKIHNKASNILANNNLKISGLLHNESIVINNYFHNNKVRKKQGYDGIKYDANIYHYQWRKWDGSTKFRRLIDTIENDQLTNMWDLYSYQTAETKKQYNSLVQSGGSLQLGSLMNYFSDRNKIKGSRVRRLKKESLNIQNNSLDFFDGNERQQQLLQNFQRNGFDATVQQLNEFLIPVALRDNLSTIKAQNLMVNGRFFNAGHIDVKDNFFIYSNDVIHNKGRIDAGNVNMNSNASIIHSGHLTSLNDLRLHSKENIHISNAVINSDGKSFLSSKKSILIKQIQDQQSDVFKELIFNNDLHILAQESIEITGSKNLVNNDKNTLLVKGNFHLESYKDIVMEAVHIKSDKSALINSAGFFNVDSLAGKDDIYQSQINIGDSLNLKTGKDFTLNGAILTANDDIYANIGRDLNLDSVIEKTKKESTKSQLFMHTVNRIFGKKTPSTERSNIIDKKAEIIAGGTMVLNTGNDLNITASKLSVGQALDATIGNDVNLNAISRETGQVQLYQKTWDVSAFSVGQDMVLKTGGTVTNMGAQMMVRGSAQMDIGSRLAMLALADESGSKTGRQVHYLKTYQKAGLDIGNHLILKTGDDVALTGTTVKTGGQSRLDIGGDVALTAVYNETFFRDTHHRKKKWYRRGKTTVSEKSSRTAVGASLDLASNSLGMIDGDIALDGSSIAIRGHAKWSVGGDVLLVNGMNEIADQTIVDYKHWSHNKSKDDGSVDQTAVRSTFTSDGAMVLDAEGSIAQIGSDIRGEQGLRIAAGDDIYIGNASEEHQSWSHSETNVLGVYEKEKRDDRSARDVLESRTSSAFNVALEAGADIEVLGSSIESGNHLVVDAADNLVVKAALETVTDQHYERKKTLDLKSVLLPDVRVENDQLKVGVTYSETEDRKTNTSASLYASRLKAGDSMSTRSGGDTTIEASDVVAVGDIRVEAEGDLVVRSADEVTETETVDKDKSIYVGVAVGNTFVDLARSTVELVASNDTNPEDEALQTEADNAGIELEEDEDAKKVSQILNKASQTAGLASKGAKVAQDVARSAASAATFGFYAQAETKTTVAKGTDTTKSTTSRAALIRSSEGDVSLVAGGKLELNGSDVASDAGDLNLEGLEVKITAAEQTTVTAHDDSTYSLSGSVDTTGLVSADASYTSTSHDQTDTTYRNSRVMAGNGAITIKSTEDITLRGANVEGQNVEIDTGNGDLIVESLQNISTMDSDSKQLSAGISVGSGTSGRFNVGKETASSDRKWVDHQTTIVGAESVTVKTNTLKNTGAVIAHAARDEEGKLHEMGDNLSVTAEKLVMADITDTDVAETKGGSFGMAGMVATIGVTDKGHEKEQITRATIGNGTLIVAGQTLDDEGREAVGVNLSVADSREMVRIKNTGGINATVSIQTDMEKVKETFEVVKDTGKNIPMAATNTIKVVGNLGKAFKQSVMGDSVDGFVSDYKGNIRNQELSLQLKLDQDEAQVIANMANSPEEMALAEQALEQIANMAAAASGVKMGKNGGVDIVMFNDPDDATMGGHKHGKIYLNMAHQDGTKETLATVLGDELSHYVDYKKRRAYSGTRQTISRGYGDDAGEQMKGYVDSDEKNIDSSLQEKLAKFDFSEANAEIAGVEGLERRVHKVNRELGGDSVKNKNNPLTHTYLITETGNKLKNTFSWGNTYDTKGHGNWHVDSKNDFHAAKQALVSNASLMLTRDDRLDSYVRNVVQDFHSDQNSVSKHKWGLFNNCKTESNRIFEQALYDYKVDNGVSYDGLTLAGTRYEFPKNYR